MGLDPDLFPFFIVDFFVETFEEDFLFFFDLLTEGGEGGFEGVGVERDLPEGAFDG